MTNQIVLLEQLPIITHKIKEAGAFIKERISGLELEKQIVTEQTIKSMKVLRAELNKEFADFEEQRKAVKTQVNNPYDEFESVYKPEITEQYKNAKDLLNSKIDEFELKIKREKQNNIKEYFDELVLSESIDFLKFEDVKLEINLSVTEKKYKEQVNEFVMKVVDDIALIKSSDYEAETMTEYKKNLNVSNAITTVKTRKEAEAAEQAKIKAELIQNRKNALLKLGLNYVEITNAYEYNEDIYVSLSDVNNRTKEEFTTIYAEIGAKIKTHIASIAVEVSAPEATTKSETITAQKPVITQPISAPVIETPAEPDSIAQFEVKAPMSKLRLLGAWMKENNIQYKNI